jgi:RHS repeat-associated protein
VHWLFLSGGAAYLSKEHTFAGITNTFGYNKRLQPLSMSAISPTQTVFSIGYDFHLGAGNNGNVFGITNSKDTTHGRDQTFTYDALNRLTSAQNAGTNCATMVLQNKTEYWGNSYSYDAWGNLINKTVTKCGAESLTVAADAHNWIHATAPDYLYDAAGNMTFNGTPPTQTYSYDQENRLTGAAGYTYTYDGDGNRVRKSNGNLAANGTLYWEMTPGVVAETDLAGTLKSEYVFFDGERVARRDGVNGAGGVFYYFSDHLKTASVITDSAGVIKAESDYYPWGGELQFVNNDSNDYKFTGKKRDTETGLDYFGARYYSNGLGRWVSADAPLVDQHLQNPQSWNLYMYAANRPTSLIDTDGREVKESKRVVTFPVQGKTYQEALQNSVTYVQSKSGLANADAWTHSEQKIMPPSVQLEVNEGNGLTPVVASEEIISVTVKLDIQENIPEWTEYSSASPEDKQSWDKEIAVIKPHEEGHAAVAENGAHAIDKALPGTRGVATGSNKTDAIKKAGAKLKVAKDKKVRDQAAKTKAEQTAWDDKAKKERDEAAH